MGRRVELEVVGMSCMGCVKRVKSALEVSDALLVLIFLCVV